MPKATKKAKKYLKKLSRKLRQCLKLARELEVSSTTRASYDSTSYLSKPYENSHEFIQSVQGNTRIGTGKKVSHGDEYLQPCSATRGHGGVEKRKTKRTANTTSHQLHGAHSH